jgi:hypothetical protein
LLVKVFALNLQVWVKNDEHILQVMQWFILYSLVMTKCATSGIKKVIFFSSKVVGMLVIGEKIQND